MSKSGKHPPYKAILDEMEKRVAELHSRRHRGSILTLRMLEVIRSLCNVLRKMKIPKRSRPKLLSKLQKLVATWDTKNDGINLIAQLLFFLISEDVTRKAGPEAGPIPGGLIVDEPEPK